MSARTGRITEPPSPQNGWRTGYDPEPERGPGESIHWDWEEMVYTVVPDDEPWPEVSEERIEQWWQLSRGPIRGEETPDDALLLELTRARVRGSGFGFTAREMRMLEEIERLRKILDPGRERPGWGSRAWQPRPGEVGPDGTRY